MPTTDTYPNCFCCGGIVVGCCEGVTLPEQLLLTLTSATCACIDGDSGTLTFVTSGYQTTEPNIQEGVWMGDISLGCGTTLHFEAYCVSAGGSYEWRWFMSNCYLSVSGGLATVSCDPLEIQDVTVNWEGCGCDAADIVTMTVTLP